MVGERDVLAAMRTPPPLFDDGRPNPNGYEGGWHDAIEEALARLAAPSPEPLPREALDVERLARRFDAAAANWRQHEKDTVPGALSSLFGYDGIPSGLTCALRAQVWTDAAEMLRAALSPDRPTPP